MCQDAEIIGVLRMDKPTTIIGSPGGAIDPDRQEIHFSLTTYEKRKPSFVVTVGVAEQIIGAIGRMVHGLREARIQKGQPNAQTVAAEDVSQALVQMDPWQKRVLLRLMTPNGVPYTFALPASGAAEIAARLKTESEKGGPTGAA